MVKGRVLIIEQDEWAAALLAKFLFEAGYQVHCESEARGGFDRVRELQPDCILCGVDLPDIDGFWVARRVRAEPGRVGATPFLFLMDEDDAQGRLQGLHVGADLLLTRPYRNEEVVAQVGALIEMAHRIVTHSLPPSEAPPSSATPTALRGDLAQVSLATVLTLLELERRSGRLKVRGPAAQSVALELSEGAFLRVTDARGTLEPLGAVREVLDWKTGTFLFRPSQVAPGDPISLSGLLLEALRLYDEAKLGD